MKLTYTAPRPMIKTAYLFLSVSVFSCFIILGQSPVSAAIVYPVSATTDGGENSATLFAIENLFNEGVTDPNQTLPAVTNNYNAYVSEAPPDSGYPVTIVADFGTPVDVSDFCLWNISHNTSDNTRNRGVKNFSLTFYDGPNATGSQIGAVFSDTAAIGPLGGDPIPAQVFDIGTYFGVLSVEFILDGVQDDDTLNWVGAREIAFVDAPPIPEPSTIVLTGLGLTGVCFRRRRGGQ